MKSIKIIAALAFVALYLCLVSASAQPGCSVNPIGIPSENVKTKRRAITTPPQTTATIQGNVVSHLTLAPVENARVTLMRQSVLGTFRCYIITDATGNFAFRNVYTGPDYDYVLTTEFPRYMQSYVDTRTFSTPLAPGFYFLFFNTESDNVWESRQ